MKSATVRRSDNCCPRAHGGRSAAGRDLAFNLTAKELEMAGTDVDFRLSAVTEALGQPHVTVLMGTELLALQITPTQYRVRATF